MKGRGKYRTKQYEELLAHLEDIRGEHFTVNDLYTCFREGGNPIGVTTLYRHLDRLIEDGVVKRYVSDKGDPACFEYIGSGDCPGHESSYHCKCENCGRLIHMRCDEIGVLREHMLNEHGFMIDPMRTVIYGLCSECMLMNSAANEKNSITKQ